MALYHLKSSSSACQTLPLKQNEETNQNRHALPNEKKKNNFDSRMHAFILLHFVTANADYLLVIYLLKQMSSVG